MATGVELDLFAVTAPGLEALCAAELAALGVTGSMEPGGVGWRGGLRTLYRSNLELRTASRVLVRLGSFRSRTFHELERRAPKLPWSAFLPRGAAVALRVTSRKSKLYHEGAVAERLARLLETAHGTRVDSMRGDEESDVGTAQLFIVRLHRDVCTISADASAALLHQRGYRQALAKAPVRETIAAALLLVSGWRPHLPLVDPLCGSGTIPIEAALLARAIAPGLASADQQPRGYAFTAWPDFDAGMWGDVVAAACAAIRNAPALITGADRNAGAVRAALANAQRAGVAADTAFEVRPLSAFAVRAGRGAIVTNPPYGVRVGDRSMLAPLYHELGSALRRAPGWTLTMLAPDPRLAAATGLPLEERLRTRNGGIVVHALHAETPARAGRTPARPGPAETQTSGAERGTHSDRSDTTGTGAE